MPKKMLIDAAHPEETRVVVLDGHRVDDFDFEVQNKKQLRGNIYLAKITRVEPSLQAAFVEYGGNRHGFLAFGEIHPDYYQIPVEDREALKAEFDAAVSDEETDPAPGAPEGEQAAEDDEEEHARLEERRRRVLLRRYKIQEVIRRRQIMLVQVVKEERGQKGAALTTYLSLAGRYCVLMPNTGRGGGISRKITNTTDRKRLKKVAADLDVAPGMGLIIRTAGAKRTKTEIKRDYEYLTRAWENIRDTTLRSVAPALIYEESSLVKRAIRDLYDKDVEEIHVEGESAYREAKDFVRMLMPSHAKKVLHWKDPTPIFTASGVERQLESIHSPVVQLKSGGYIVINQTEALVAIDVNSGRATRERNIEQTALKTNLEAADEAARQMRLRDLAGLVVLDFIDMEEAKNDRSVEKRMKDCLRHDRARVQMGKISPFGLLELSRQRRRTGVLEGSTHICPHCAGSGRVRSVESSALKLLRVLDEACQRHPGETLEVRAPTEVALYVLNEKRETLARLEDARGVRIRVSASTQILAPDFEITPSGGRIVDGEDLVEARPPRARGAGRPIERPPIEAVEADLDEDEVTSSDEGGDDLEADAENGRRQEGGGRRRRGRRGGKRRRDEIAAPLNAEPAPRTGEETEYPASADDRGDRTGRRRRRRRGRTRLFAADSGEHLDALATDPLPSLLPPAPTLAIEDESPEPTVAAERAPSDDEAASAAQPPKLQAVPPPAAPESEAPALVDAPEAPLAEPEPEPDYEPDVQKRQRFFARLSRWGKKTG